MEALEEGVITTKAPHYFQVHFYERYVVLDNGCAHGKPYPITCDGFSYNVYGFRSAEEAALFDSKELRSILRATELKWQVWPADTLEELMEDINTDPRFKSGIYTLSEDNGCFGAPYGAIENLPSCERMHSGTDGYLYCGKPVGEYQDGCYGGCVLQGCDQDDEFHDGFQCPIKKFQRERFAEFQRKRMEAQK